MDDSLLPPDGDGGEPVVLVVQHRRHRFPGRGREVKALYDDTEYAAVAAAAAAAGLTPGGYVAVAALTAAGTASTGPGLPRAQSPAVGDRVLLGELLEARAGLRRYAVNLNQAVIVLHQRGGPPVWLRQAVSGCDRAVQRLDAVTSRLADRLGAR